MPGGASDALRATTTSAGDGDEPRRASAARPSGRTSDGGLSNRFAAARPLDFAPAADKLNHGAFRYPAKFHPPIARALVELFTTRGQTVLDPFCGSGTLLVEALASGRNAVGADIDPLAAFVAEAKTTGLDIAVAAQAAAELTEWLKSARTEDIERSGEFTQEIDETTFATLIAEVAGSLPDIPNIAHWFRRRVQIQLATIRRRILETGDPGTRRFLLLCFAAIIRNSSNADPVPVSGLEVTSHMLAKEALGRAIDPWRLLERRLTTTLGQMRAFGEAAAAGRTAAVHLMDARDLDGAAIGEVHAIVTSPPYLTAVDYYRRHTLEMYWLGLTVTRAERLELMGRYIGRDRVPASRLPGSVLAARTADRWLARFGSIKIERERAFRHYCDGMARALTGMADVVVEGGPVVVVAGDVRFCGHPVSMLELMKDLAGDRLVIDDHLWYPIQNRYMSYSRNNEADIAADHVLAFRAV